MEKERGSVLLRVLVSIGIVLFALNSIFFYINTPKKALSVTIFFSFVVQILLGLAVVICSLLFTNKSYQFFIGLLLCGWGILSGLITYVLPYNDKYWWPLYLIEASVFIFLAGKIKYGRLKFGYLIPSLSLFIMGIWFSLFSFKIVTVSFKTIVILFGPAFIGLMAISLICVFLIQKHHKKLILLDEDSGDFDDEEISLPKLD